MRARAERKKILVVDDDEKIRTILRHMLEREGYEVYTAANGDAGVKAAVSVPPDAILLDIMMPEKDGFDACAELKRVERTKDVPVIFLTARVGDEPRKRAQHRAATAFVEKPFKREALLAVVKEALEGAKKA